MKGSDLVWKILPRHSFRLSVASLHYLNRFLHKPIYPDMEASLSPFIKANVSTSSRNVLARTLQVKAGNTMMMRRQHDYTQKASHSFSPCHRQCGGNAASGAIAGIPRPDGFAIRPQAGSSSSSSSRWLTASASRVGEHRTATTVTVGEDASASRDAAGEAVGDTAHHPSSVGPGSRPAQGSTHSNSNETDGRSVQAITFQDAIQCLQVSGSVAASIKKQSCGPTQIADSVCCGAEQMVFERGYVPPTAGITRVHTVCALHVHAVVCCARASMLVRGCIAHCVGCAV